MAIPRARAAPPWLCHIFLKSLTRAHCWQSHAQKSNLIIDAVIPWIPSLAAANGWCVNDSIRALIGPLSTASLQRKGQGWERWLEPAVRFPTAPEPSPSCCPWQGYPSLDGTLRKASLVEGLQRERYGLRRASSQELEDFPCCKRGPFPGSPAVKNLSCNAGNMGSIPGQWTKIPHLRTNKPEHCNHWAHAPQLDSPCVTNYRTHTLWTPCATTGEPVGQHRRSCVATKTQSSQVNNSIFKVAIPFLKICFDNYGSFAFPCEF